MSDVGLREFFGGRPKPLPAPVPPPEPLSLEILEQTRRVADATTEIAERVAKHFDIKEAWLDEQRQQRQ